MELITMRITNQMMTNTILMNINRNKASLSEYETQLATGKKIQKPSDDPIVAVRALRFRTSVNEITQYKTNAEDATSWASVSEQAVSNVTSIIDRLRELSVQSATDVMSASNRGNVVTEMSELTEQFLSEANASYAGRYVFGGFKTSTPVVTIEESTDQYKLTEDFTSDAVEEVQRVYEGGANPEIITINRIRLGYSNVTNGDEAALMTALGGGFTAMNTVSADDVDAYLPAENQVNFIEETGELIFNSADLTDIPEDFKFTYEKHGLAKTDLAPEHYFNGENMTTGAEFQVGSEDVKYQISYSQDITVNTMSYDVISIDMQRDMEELVSFTENLDVDDSLATELNEGLLGDKFSDLLGKLDKHMDQLLNTRAAIGGKINRLELTISRLDADELNFTDLLSENEDVDYAEVYIKMSSMETVYQASLSASSKVLQPTLLDFI